MISNGHSDDSKLFLLSCQCFLSEVIIVAICFIVYGSAWGLLNMSALKTSHNSYWQVLDKLELVYRSKVSCFELLVVHDLRVSLNCEQKETGGKNQPRVLCWIYLYLGYYSGNCCDNDQFASGSAEYKNSKFSINDFHWSLWELPVVSAVLSMFFACRVCVGQLVFLYRSA